eukprot:jgi/Mesvir1/17272/Mv07680-RA.1
MCIFELLLDYLSHHQHPFPMGQLQGRKLLQSGPCSQIINADSTVAILSDSYGPAPTNWQRTLAVSQFDRGCGTLSNVSISFIGGVSGVAAYESLEANPAVITLNLKAEIKFRRFGSNFYYFVHPVKSQVSNAGAYDNVLDFGGTSGATFPGMNASRASGLTLYNIGSSEFVSATAGTVGQIYYQAAATAASIYRDWG